MMIDFSRWRPSILHIETVRITEEQRGHFREKLWKSDYEFLERPQDPYSSVFVLREHLPA